MIGVRKMWPNDTCRDSSRITLNVIDFSSGSSVCLYMLLNAPSASPSTIMFMPIMTFM